MYNLGCIPMNDPIKDIADSIVLQLRFYCCCFYLVLKNNLGLKANDLIKCLSFE